MRYWEDFAEGTAFEVGPVELTEADIVEFASRYDPQPFHVDPDAAGAGPFGGLIASGWHTAALLMGMYVREVLADAAGMGSPGVEELRWLVPVRPGDVLRGRVTVLERWPSERRPGRGTVVSRFEVLNQRDETVLTMRARGLFARRDP